MEVLKSFFFSIHPLSLSQMDSQYLGAGNSSSARQGEKRSQFLYWGLTGGTWLRIVTPGREDRRGKWGHYRGKEVSTRHSIFPALNISMLRDVMVVRWRTGRTGSTHSPAAATSSPPSTAPSTSSFTSSSTNREKIITSPWQVWIWRSLPQHWSDPQENLPTFLRVMFREHCVMLGQ